MKHLLFSLNLLLLNGCLIGGYPNGKITIAITDEVGNAVTNHSVGIAWERMASANPWDGTTYHGQRENTDENGLVTFSSSGLRNVYYNTRNNFKYYDSTGEYEFTDLKYGKMQPWNPTVTLRVRKIGEPTAMYAKNKPRLNLPARELSYDLIKGEFLPPYGKGETADCVLTYTVSEEGTPDTLDYRLEQKLTLTFPGDFNGVTPIPDSTIINESAFRLPRYAPENGYESPVLSVTQLSTVITVPTTVTPSGRTRRETVTRVPDSENVFFRIRAEKNPDGTFKSALYGKLRGPLTIERSPETDKDGNRKIFLRKFSHYVNPTRNDLNMEFDTNPTGNLTYKNHLLKAGSIWYIPSRAYPYGEVSVGEP